MLTRSQLIILGVIVVLLAIVSGVYIGILPGLKPSQSLQSITLRFWGVNDDPSAFNEVVADYQKNNPRVQIKYRRIDEKNYEQEVLNALAANEPVDIIMFKNSWLPKHFDKIIPLTAITPLLEKQNAPTLSWTDFKNIFPTVAVQDFAPDKIIYAFPLYIDTLAMIYNRDIFDSRGIAVPPRNWSAFQEAVARLRLAEAPQNGAKAGFKSPVAIGGSNQNIANATDLLNLLFLQSGAPMINENFTRADFAAVGENVLSFYSQFANPKSPYFSWTSTNKYSLDSFAQGQTAAIFGYHQQTKNIRDANPSLSFQISAMPQPTASTQTINWANYYGLAVPQNSANPQEAWKFILFLAANQAESKKYLDRADHPPALRKLINEKLTDPEMGVFANQSLSARSYPQIDDNAVSDIFSKMIESVITGQSSPFSATIQAEGEVTRLIQQRKR